ncbi:MAG TPA: DUF2344 domain-containing protein [Elusimicrobiales bacterium]|nr:DUF2344 domain-containing protein [Elusimicrobiales bacterium]
MIRYRFIFSKSADCPITSFLKQIEYFRDFFVSNFDLHNGKKTKFSFGPALPFGYESECEYVDVLLKNRMKEEEVKTIIDKNIGFGYSLLSFKTIPVHFPSVESVTDAIEYEIYPEEKIDADLILKSEYFEKKQILNFTQEKDILRVVLKKELSLKTMIEKLMKDVKFKKIVGKKLYWQDLSGVFKII